jgi:surfactin synthase thioesterase subunit
VDTSDRWLGSFCPRPNARLRLFCLPHAGGGAVEYRSWSDDLSEDVEVHPVHLPGRESRLQEPAFDRIEPLVEALVEALGAGPRRPYALFGHSMGALVAFELARELRRRSGPAPKHLFLSGRSAPRYPSPARAVHSLPEADFIEYLRTLNGTPDVILGDAQMRALFPLCARILRLAQYRYREDASTPHHRFLGMRDFERTPVRPRVEEGDSASFARMLPATISSSAPRASLSASTS